MIKIEKIKVEGWEPAIRGMRNPLDSWEKSDSYNNYTVEYDDDSNSEIHHPYYRIGAGDLALMMKLAKSGMEHAKYRRMIVVWMDITAPLYWWKEFDTYKVGTVANSCSTMHTIHKREFTLDDFSCEHLSSYDIDAEGDHVCEGIPYTASGTIYSTDHLLDTVTALNYYRRRYLETKDKKYWWQLIQLLPSSYNQKRTVMLNYEVLANIYRQRRNHKLDEWHTFCDMIEEKLPYYQLITLKNPEIEKEANNICNLVMNNASENDIKEAVEKSIQVMNSKKSGRYPWGSNMKVVEEDKAYLEKQREILQKNYDVAMARGETWISVKDLMKGSMFEDMGNPDITDGFDLSAEKRVENLVNIKRLVDITESYIEADLKEDE